MMTCSKLLREEQATYLQPVLFEPMTIVNPTRGQYKILSYLDINPLKHMLENFETFTHKLLTHIQNTMENAATIEVLDALDSRTDYANSFQLLFAKASTQATELRDMYSCLCLQFLETLDYLRKPSKCQNQLLKIAKILSRNQTISRNNGDVSCLVHLFIM